MTRPIKGPIHSDDGKRQLAKMAGWLWTVCVAFRLRYRNRCRLSILPCFGTVTIIIVIVYRLFCGYGTETFRDSISNPSIHT